MAISAHSTRAHHSRKTTRAASPSGLVKRARARLAQAFVALSMGRSRKAVLLEIAAGSAATAALWFPTCVFVLLEPLP